MSGEDHASAGALRAGPAPPPPADALADIARWLRRRPGLLAAWLAVRNRGPRAALLATGALGLFCGLAWGLGRSGAYRAAAAHPLVLGASIAVIWGFGVAQRAHRLRAARTRSWLAALPTRSSVLGHLILLPLGAATAVLLALVIAALAAHRGAGPLAHAVLAALGATAIGTLVGALPWGRRRSSVAQSWYTSVGGARTGRSRPSLWALGYWPVARSQVAARPKWKAAGLLLILLGLPAGAQNALLMHEALAATAAWFIAQYLLALLAALIRVAFAAAWWLAPTSLGLARFTLSLSYLALLRHLAICVLVVAALAALAGTGWALPLPSALLAAAGWMVFCTVAGGSACAWAYRPAAIGRSRLHRRLR